MSKEFLEWDELSSEQLLQIAKFINKYCYGNVDINMNDTFAYATGWGVEADVYDLPGLIELESKFGGDGIDAWCAVKEGVDSVIRPGKQFKEAKKYIEENRTKYFWLDRYKQEHNK